MSDDQMSDDQMSDGQSPLGFLEAHDPWHVNATGPEMEDLPKELQTRGPRCRQILSHLKCKHEADPFIIRELGCEWCEWWRENYDMRTCTGLRVTVDPLRWICDDECYTCEMPVTEHSSKRHLWIRTPITSIYQKTLEDLRQLPAEARQAELEIRRANGPSPLSPKPHFITQELFDQIAQAHRKQSEMHMALGMCVPPPEMDIELAIAQLPPQPEGHKQNRQLPLMQGRKWLPASVMESTRGFEYHWLMLTCRSIGIGGCEKPLLRYGVE